MGFPSPSSSSSCQILFLSALSFLFPSHNLCWYFSVWKLVVIGLGLAYGIFCLHFQLHFPYLQFPCLETSMGWCLTDMLVRIVLGKNHEICRVMCQKKAEGL